MAEKNVADSILSSAMHKNNLVIVKRNTYELNGLINKCIYFPRGQAGYFPIPTIRILILPITEPLIITEFLTNEGVIPEKLYNEPNPEKCL